VPALPLIDTHAHVFHHMLPMAADRRYTPSYDATVRDYLATLDSHGFHRGVLVQPSFLGADNDYLLEALAAAPERLVGVAVLDDPSTADLRRLHAGGIRGIRLNLVGRQLPDLGAASWQHAGERMAEIGWHLEIQAREKQWRLLAADIRRWPGRVVIDHLGLPADSDEGAVLSLAQLPHVWVKLSAPYRGQPDAATARARELTRTGCGDRMVFGSDWPFTGHEGHRYGELVAWARSTVGSGCFTEVLPRNAATLLGLT
jgi:predicted TIM-barrel fold metal-dependent hydrolase